MSVERVPQEISPFITALNRLFGRVEQSLRTEREFTDNASHELRTPLAAMKTQAQVLLKQSSLHPAQRQAVDELLASINRAAHMVEQLLAFSRLQHLHETAGPLDLGELTRDALREAAPLALRRSQNLHVDIRPGIVVDGVPAALTVMVRNILDNAIKYSPDGGDIWVSVTEEKAKPVLTVSDSGAGIPREHQERVFDRFYRINQGDDHGSGLGLSMVRWIAELHQAEIRLENPAAGGLKLTVTFSAPASRPRS